MGANAVDHRPIGIAAVHGGHGLLVDDALGIRVGQVAFEPVADFDSSLAIVHEQDENDAVVLSFPADLRRMRGLRCPEAVSEAP
jgi:hypothetical protein